MTELTLGGESSCPKGLTANQATVGKVHVYHVWREDDRAVKPENFATWLNLPEGQAKIKD